MRQTKRLAGLHGVRVAALFAVNLLVALMFASVGASIINNANDLCAHFRARNPLLLDYSRIPLSLPSSLKAAAECAENPRCYPSHVKFLARPAAIVAAGATTNFTLLSYFPRDIFYAYLEGPEILPVHVTALGATAIKDMPRSNGSFSLGYCASVSGLYKLHINIGQIDGVVGFRRSMFLSPLSIAVLLQGDRVTAPVAEPKPQLEPAFCTTAATASDGRWVRYDILGYSASSWAEVAAGTTRDPYIWQPFNCALPRPGELTPSWTRTALEGTRICVCGDSYARTLIAGFAAWAGILNAEELLRHEYSHQNWQAGGVHFFWGGCANYKNGSRPVAGDAVNGPAFDSCMELKSSGFGPAVGGGKPDRVLALESRLLIDSQTQELVATLRRRAAVSKREGGGSRYIVMNGHAWSGDLIALKRQNVAIQRTAQVLHASSAVEGTSEHQKYDVLDAFAMSLPRSWDSACDGSHFNCQGVNETSVDWWMGAILAHLGSRI